MTDIKIDTCRSSLFDKSLSDAETESETIDDFSQYSDHVNDKIPEKLSIDSRSETPISKGIPIQISGNDGKIREKNSHSVSLNEEKDNSEDTMVEISKKKTIKKIISKTTAVNGVTQASEFEEFIVKDIHMNENINHQRNLKLPKPFKDPTYLEFQTAMNDTYINENIFSKSNGYHDPDISEIIEVTKAQNTFQGRETVNKSPESSVSETIEKSNVYKSFQEHDNFDGSPESNVSETNKALKMQESHKTLEYFLSGKNTTDMTHNAFKAEEIKHKTIHNKSNLHNNELNESEKELRNKKSASHFTDNNAEKKKNLILNNDFKSQSYKNEFQETKIKDKNKFIWPKDKEKDKKVKGKYLDDHDEYRNLKSTSTDPKMQFNETYKSKANLKSMEKHIKWVDPFKSYHLKYDLKDNGRLMQNWIKQKQQALHRSDSNYRMKNSISSRSIKYRSTPITNPLPLAPSINKKNTHNDIKEYIIRGNIKENLFQARHSFPQFTKFENYFQYLSKEDAIDFSKSYEKTNIKPIRSLISNVDEIKPRQALELGKRRDNDLNFQVSKILNKFDLIEQGMKHRPSNLRVQQKYCDEFNYGHRNCYKTVCCYNSCQNFCTCRCGPYNYTSMNDNNFENGKYLSYESSAVSPINYKDFSADYSLGYNKTKSSTFDFSSKTLKHDSNQFYGNESEVSNRNTGENQIDYLETKLNTIEKRIRNIKLNRQKSVYECEIDLECQCREIEKQLESLYKVTPSIREVA